MSERPKVAVISGFGINCETETMAVFEMAGASADRIHVNRLVNGEVSLDDYHIMAVPGGFSFGDHLGSGRLMGNRLRFGLREQVREFVRAGKPVIGICNGFQVLVKMGLLPGDDEVSLTQTASLALNDSGHYENRWATLEFDSNSPCIWTKGLSRMRVPVRHGEGKFVTDDRILLDRWAETGQLVARYVDPSTEYPGASDEVLPYPVSPNQSWRNIAGVCDPSGLVFGLMPHPEANHSTWLGATWTREDTEHGEGEGMAIFHNAVEYAASRM
jgi:phosphoribosylformylglycinamidine synthase|tara:strand:- start:62 stop:877 length:816 start_codon:yes stop_codon:yes gene_type:complete